MTRARDLASGLAGVRPFAMASGTGTASVTQAPQSGWNWGSATVTFPANRFTVTPVISINANGPYSVNAPITSYVSTKSASSFNYFMWGTVSQSWDFAWSATQMTSGAASG